MNTILTKISQSTFTLAVILNSGAMFAGGVDLGNSGDPLFHLMNDANVVVKRMLNDVDAKRVAGNNEIPRFVKEWYAAHDTQLKNLKYQIAIRDENQNGLCGEVELATHTIFFSKKDCDFGDLWGVCQRVPSSSGDASLNQCLAVSEFVLAEVLHFMDLPIPENQEVARSIRKAYVKGPNLEGTYYWTWFDKSVGMRLQWNEQSGDYSVSLKQHGATNIIFLDNYQVVPKGPEWRQIEINGYRILDYSDGLECMVPLKVQMNVDKNIVTTTIYAHPGAGAVYRCPTSYPFDLTKWQKYRARFSPEINAIQ